jgi:hypothetical protein
VDSRHDLRAVEDGMRFEERGELADRLRRQLEPHELRVAVGEARAGEPALVDESEDGAVLVEHSPLPGFGDERDLVVVELGEGTDVLRRVDHDLLPLEGGVEVRNDADLPRIAEPKRLRGCAVLAADVEGTALEFLLRRRLELRQPGAGPVAAAWGVDDPSACERILE